MYIYEIATTYSELYLEKKSEKYRKLKVGLLSRSEANGSLYSKEQKVAQRQQQYPREGKPGLAGARRDGFRERARTGSPT